MKTHHVFFSEWSNVLDPGRNELVFENRNKEYGAYAIRRNYHKSLVTALFLALIFLSSVFLISFIFSFSNIEIIKNVVNLKKDIVQNEIIIDLTKIKPKSSDIDKPKNNVQPPSPKKSVASLFTVVNDTSVASKDSMFHLIDIPQTILAGGNKNNVPAIGGNGNDSSKISGTGQIEDTLKWAEVMPEFPGGYLAMSKFISNHLIYPQIGRENRITGRIYLKFKVNKKGEISDIGVEHGIRGFPEFEMEAINVIKMMPAWKPGMQDGKPVSVFFTLPISFNLN